MSPCELSHLIDRVRIGTLLDMEMAMPRTAQASVPALLPIMGSVFISFLIIGVAMPVLPLHVHQGLGLGTFIVGLVAGSQFAASLVSRVWAGRHADGRGAKHAVATGLVLAAVAGVLYLLSLRFVSAPAISVTILLLGRALLGAGESFIITGAQAWGLALSGAQNTGKVLAWMGTAMYAAFALGAPAGTVLYGSFGFTAIALATTLVPLAALLLGAALTGFGYSLVYPGFGVEAVRRAPAQSRGLAMGAYTAFLDVALALASPALGLIAAMSDIGTVFLASALSVLCAAPVALRLKGMR